MIASTRTAKPSLLLSPNSILANALLRSIDILRPRVLAARPSRIEFVVGAQINGAPHLGTNLVQTAAFLLAKIARREFSIDTRVRFSALDNAPYEVVLDPETHTAYQRSYYHALGKDKIAVLIEGYYRAFFGSLAEATDISSVTSVNLLAPREEQLADIRQIYPPEREALGVVAIGIELIEPPRRP